MGIFLSTILSFLANQVQVNLVLRKTFLFVFLPALPSDSVLLLALALSFRFVVSLSTRVPSFHKHPLEIVSACIVTPF